MFDPDNITGSCLKIHDVLQGSDKWLALRFGALTASEMKHIVTPSTLKPASNDKERSHLYELAAQVVTQYAEPHFISDDMLRGIAEEQTARDLYSEHYAPVKQCGFITNNKWGFTIGYSPDGLVGDDGLIEIKCPRQKTQFVTLTTREMPSEHMLQVQTGMLVAERSWCDFISHCGGMPLAVIRVHADAEIQEAIVNAAEKFTGKLAALVAQYRERIADKAWKLIPTERRIEQEIV
jgi:hypothetical protein